MLGFLLGYMAGSNSDSGSGGSVTKEQPRVTPGDVYVNGEAILRVQNPLDIKTSCSGTLNFQNEDTHKLFQETFRSLFERIRPEDSGAYEILRITRVVAQDKPYATFWFEFIEKDKLAPKT